jgi:NADPH:quinone reductase-like Zn-dependent oxidoreductase
MAEALIDVMLQKRMKIVSVKANSADLDKLKELAEKGQLEPYIGKSFPLEHLAAAHTLQEGGRFRWKNSYHHHLMMP